MSIDPASAIADAEAEISLRLKMWFGIPAFISPRRAILACIQIEFIPKMHSKFLYSGVTGAPIMTTIRTIELREFS